VTGRPLGALAWPLLSPPALAGGKLGDQLNGSIRKASVAMTSRIRDLVRGDVVGELGGGTGRFSAAHCHQEATGLCQAVD
jgi:hypothetical protein